MASNLSIDSYRDELVQLLRELVSFPSVRGETKDGRPFGEAVDGVYRHLLARAKADGFETFDADGWGGHIEWIGMETDERGEAVVAATETIGIPIHLDVVPAGDGWTADPWTLREDAESGRLYGRGTSDDKGPAVCAYVAMKALKDSGFVPSRNVRLILGLDEETGNWEGMAKYFEKATKPDFGFSPDADFPVIRGEKGMMVFEIAKKLEPSHEQGLHVRSIEGGNAPNMVPDRCRAILIEEKQKYEPVREAVEAFRARTGHKVYFKGRGKSVEVSAEGVAAHGAHPEDGLNAISILMELLSELPIANEGAAAFIDFYREHIDYETNGHRLGIEACDEESGGLIVNVGQIALGREAAILTVNVRNPVTRKEDDVYDDLRPVIDRYDLGVVRVTGVAPLYYADGDPLVETLMDVYRAGTGDAEAQPLVIGGGTYARAIPHAVAFGPRFPGKPDVMHQKDEYIEEQDLLRACRIYADAIARLAGKDFRL